ncbi:hypothetical protein Kpol_1023p38 [Vanderwaltozyma polyspora DSM 70294]|uniref:Mediator of RNA polymerase II transcription subunit 6 n=1 Tax=Vanderwaltozyma polyspora (strain ATCC 22028 / DSM 70294 / BCRC 21397 / CBS 2163 / NBRC 10782 / NRRL Y-8283 / UCD 57-17) TaxID=436907 RepID=A7TFR1_VANPO|nr:uncharacterized protein Kpol_1023p38 [Vanderwaltozyma polyspora DSM 70294]EDO18869.1 hypothetical protein Kpol_1023p38 [Vanderwaltozyma polyspora DSM 70294]
MSGQPPLDELQWKSPEWIQAFGLRTDNVLDYFAESPFFEKTSNNQVIKMQRQFSQMPVMDNPSGNTPANGGGDQQQQQQQQQQSQQSQQQQQSQQSQQQQQQQINIFKTSVNHQDQDQEFGYVDMIRRDILTRYPMHAMLERELGKMKGVEYVLSYVREPDFWIIKKQNRISSESTQPLQAYYIIGANVYQSPTVFKVVQSRLLSTSYHLSSTLKTLRNLIQFEPSQGVQFKTIQDESYSTPTSTSNNDIGTNGNSVSNTTLSASATVATTQPASTSQFDHNGFQTNQDKLTRDMMDTLMVMSIKSKPEYI